MCIKYCVVTKSNAFGIYNGYHIDLLLSFWMCRVDFAYLHYILRSYKPPCIRKSRLSSYWFIINLLECIFALSIGGLSNAMHSEFLIDFQLIENWFRRMCKVDLAYVHEVLHGYEKQCILNFKLFSYWLSFDIIECAKSTWHTCIEYCVVTKRNAYRISDRC